MHIYERQIRDGGRGAEQAHSQIQRAVDASNDLLSGQPFSARAHAVSGAFFARLPDAFGDEHAVRAEQQLRTALTLDPRHYGARRMLAELLRHRGESARALYLAEAGLAFPAVEHPAVLPYLGLTVVLQIEAGRLDAARATF